MQQDQLTTATQLVIAIAKSPIAFIKLAISNYKASKLAKPAPKHDPLVMSVKRDTTTPIPSVNQIYQQLLNHHAKQHDSNYPSSFSA